MRERELLWRESREPAMRNTDPLLVIVFDASPPKNWTFAERNQRTDGIITQLEGVPFKRIAHRAGRLVLFAAGKFHMTDEIDFGPGYTSRRINLTFLYR